MANPGSDDGVVHGVERGLSIIMQAALQWGKMQHRTQLTADWVSAQWGRGLSCAAKCCSAAGVLSSTLRRVFGNSLRWRRSRGDSTQDPLSYDDEWPPFSGQSNERHVSRGSRGSSWVDSVAGFSGMPTYFRPLGEVLRLPAVLRELVLSDTRFCLIVIWARGQSSATWRY